MKKLYQSKYLLILVSILGVYFVLHTPFLITDYLGEEDAARLVNDSIRASHNGRYINMHYGLASSPLYSAVLRFCFEIGKISIQGVTFWMALASLFSGAAITIAMFIFVYRLTTSFLSALGASFILQLIPIFWFSSLYGFTTMVALAFFMMSLVFFQGALIDRLSICKYLQLFGAMFLYILAVLTKADILLASAIFCLPVWSSDFSIKKKTILIGCLVLFSGIAVLLHRNFIHILAPSEIFSLDSWNKEFPLSFSYLFSLSNLILTSSGVGIVSIPAAFIGLILMGWRKEWRPAIFWLVLSGLPLALFWCLRPGNSARHVLIPGLFLCIILAFPLMMRTWRKWAWTGFLSVILLVNYLYFPPVDRPQYFASGRIFNTNIFEERVKKAHLTGREIANLPYHEKMVVIGEMHLQPYFRHEVLRSSHLSYVNHTITPNEAETTLEMLNKNRKQLFLWLHKKQKTSETFAEILDLVQDGYFIVILDKGMAELLSHMLGLKGKWVFINV